MWLDDEITEGIQRLLVLRLKFSPALDTIDPLVDTWIAVFKAQPMQWVESVDAPRIRQAFMLCAGKCDEFPTPKTVLTFLPSRPERLKIKYEEERVIMPETIKQMLRQAISDSRNFTEEQRQAASAKAWQELQAFSKQK